MVGHWTFENQLTCLSAQNMFGSDIKDKSKIRQAYKQLFILVTCSVYVSNKAVHLEVLQGTSS